MIHYDNTTDLDPEDILNLQEKLKLYEAVLNNILSGVLITDPGGKVIFFSETYGHFLNMDPKTKIGKHCTEVIENTRMHVVAETGKPEINFPIGSWAGIWSSSVFPYGSTENWRPFSGRLFLKM